MSYERAKEMFDQNLSLMLRTAKTPQERDEVRNLNEGLIELTDAVERDLGESASR